MQRVRSATDTQTCASEPRPQTVETSVAQEKADPDKIAEAILSGVPLKEVYGISSEMMDAIYAQAYSLYQVNKLDEAEKFFRFLCIYDFHNPDYAIGLGAVYQLKKDYQKAIEMYAAAYIVGDKELRPVLYAGQCALLLNQRDKARQCFELVSAETEDERLQSTARSYLKMLASTASDSPQKELIDVRKC